MSFIDTSNFDASLLRINLQHNQRTNKDTVVVSYGDGMKSIAFVAPPCVTNWPRCTGDGNFKSGQFGAETLEKASLTLDLSCDNINNEVNTAMLHFQQHIIEAIDDAVLDFFYNNQMKLLGRKNLSKAEVKVLQIRASKEKINRDTGDSYGRSMNASAKRVYWDQTGNKRLREINICDVNGKIIENAQVMSGDIVSANIQLDHVYTGVGGDKFGCHWHLHDVCVIAQAHRMPKPTAIDTFNSCDYSRLPYATDYEHCSEPASFSAAMEVTG